MTLALRKRCLADRAGSCRGGARCAWCVRRTPGRGELLSSRAAFHTVKPDGNSSHSSPAQPVSLTLPPTTFIPPDCSEPHPPVKQAQHLAISNQKFWKRRNLHLNCCCLSLTRIIFLPEVGLTHPQHALQLASSLPSAPQPSSEHTGFLPSQWDGAFTLLNCLYVSKKKGILAATPEPPLSILASVNFSKDFKCGLHLLFPVGFVTLPAPQVSGCQHVSPRWLGSCYSVLKLVCFFNGYK